jgi:hypothetical protein
MKTTLIILLLVLSIQKTNAQTSDATIQSGITEFISWITNLDEQVNNIYKTQNKNKLIRQLGYIGSDLDYLASEKAKLAETVIEQHNSEKSELSIELLNEYKESIDNLNRNISKLIVMLNDQYQIEGNEILDKIRHDLNSRKEVELEAITKMLTDNNKFDEDAIRESAERARLNAISARDAVFELRKKLLAD